VTPVERVVTHVTFELDGGSWEVDNNIWIIGDDSNVVVFDAAHTAHRSCPPSVGATWRQWCEPTATTTT
jgi:hypothetical protein